MFFQHEKVVSIFLKKNVKHQKNCIYFLVDYLINPEARYIYYCKCTKSVIVHQQLTHTKILLNYMVAHLVFFKFNLLVDLLMNSVKIHIIKTTEKKL